MNNNNINTFNGPQESLNSPILNGTSTENNASQASGMSFTSPSESKETPKSDPNVCPFCGYRVSSNNNMCMHCGKVLKNAMESKNVLNPDYAITHTKEDNGEVINGNPGPIYGVTTILLILSIIGTCLLSSSINNELISKSMLLLITIPSLIVSFFYTLIWELLLFKANLPWWGMFIPGYNIFLLSKLMTNRYGYILKIIYPSIVIAGLEFLLAQSVMTYFYLLSGVYLLVLWICMVAKMSERFNVNFALLLFFPWIMLPIMAFSKRINCI